MKKINNLSQLKAEKQRLQLQRLRLETKMRDDWQALRSSLRPSQILRSMLQKKQSTTVDNAQEPVSKLLYRQIASWIFKKMNERRRKAN